MSSNPLAATAQPIASAARVKYENVGYVGSGFENTVSMPDGKSFNVVNITFDRGTDFGKLAEALSKGMTLSLRPRKEATKRHAKQNWSLVLRRPVAAA